MRIIDRYIGRSFLVAFAVGLGIFTFVMCIGLIFKVTDLLARGAAWQLILYIFMSGVPSSLPFAMPVSVLTASLLVFGKMSADNEIVAMKASGISIWRIMATPVVISLLLAVIGIYVSSEVAPKGRFIQRKAIKALGVQASLKLLEEGRFIRDFPGLTVYMGRKSDNRIYDIIIYDSTHGKVRREIRAKSGTVEPSADQRELIVNLFDVRVDPFYEDRPGAGFCREWPIRIPVDTARYESITKKEGDFTGGELLDRILNVDLFFKDLNAENLLKQRMSLIVELNKRLALPFSCFAFVMLGLPLGIKAHRKESSIGIAISLVLVLNFYVFVVIANTLARRPDTYPYLFLWFPILASTALGLYLARRSA